MTTNRACAVLLGFVLVGSLPRAGLAQTQTPPPTEAQLLERTVQFPNDIGALLDLAKLYIEQRRFDDASRTLNRATAAVQREQALAFTQAPPAVKPYDGPAPLRVGGGVREPRRIKFVAPVYPPIAQDAKVQGYVIIEVIVDTNGQVRDPKVIKSNALLDQAAVDAVRQWEYEPPTLNGVPVAAIMSVTVIFSMK